MTGFTLQAIRERIITLERELDAFRRSEEALRELASLQLAHDVTTTPTATNAATNGRGRHRTTSVWIPAILMKLGRPATVGMVRKGLLGRRVSKCATYEALATLASSGAIRRVARGVYEKV